MRFAGATNRLSATLPWGGHLKMKRAYVGRAVLAGIFVGGATLAPANLHAQEPGATGEISLETLLEIVVSSTLREQTTLDAPSSIIVVNADEIRARGYRSIKQILNDVP